jgi:hypothetical protein
MTAPTPEPPLDVVALRRLATKFRELEGPALAGEIDAARWMSARGDLNRELLRQLPAILAALTELEGLRAEVARLFADLLEGEDLDQPVVNVWENVILLSEHPRIAAILRAAREAEEVSGG